MGRNVIVIGGGLGALSGAIRLAKMGFDVQLFEQNEKLGGKMGEFTDKNYRFDTGPSLLTMNFVIDELFNFAGFNRPDLLEFVSVDPICRYFFPDNSIIDTSSNLDNMLESIRKIAPQDVNSYLKFIKYCEQIYDLTADIFLFTPIHEIRKLIKKTNLNTLINLYKMDPFRTMHKSVSSFFTDQRFIQIFDRYATYNGSDPFEAPATLNIISYVEYVLGGYYIKGGMYRLVDTLENIAYKLGVKIYKSTRVDKILWSDSNVSGVKINNEFIHANYILCGADVINTYDHLIEGKERKQKKLNNLEPSISGMVYLWGINKKNPSFLHHNIIFSEDYKKEFYQIFKEQKAPDDPTIYISITSKTDPEHAPENSENWFVLLNMPYLTSKNEHLWKTEINRMREVIFTKLRKIGIDISNNIEVEKVYTPRDFYHLYSSNRGSIYGVSSNSRSMAFRRHPNRSRDIDGLYFAGGSVHPGGGIPLVLSSGRLASELITEASGSK